MTVRVAMWSGPRNLSTAMMRSFSSRSDCAVSDEPFYAAFLARSGLVHPMQAEVMAAQPRDPAVVAADMLGPVPGGKSVWYQKHMAHHMLPDFPLDWMGGVHNAFLIRSPESVLASYVQKRESPGLDDIGFIRQAELFDRVAQRLGAAPPVIEADDVRENPPAVLMALCAAVGLDFQPAMLGWPAGPHASDGVWAPHWYNAIYTTTGFSPPERREPPRLPAELARLAEAARPSYERLRSYKLTA